MKNFPKEKPLRSKSKSGGGGVACDEEACCAVPAIGTGWVRPTHPVCGFSTGPTFFPSFPKSCSPRFSPSRLPPF